MLDPAVRNRILFSLSLTFSLSVFVIIFFPLRPILLREHRTALILPRRDLEFRRRRFAVRLLLSFASSSADSPFDEVLLWFEMRVIQYPPAPNKAFPEALRDLTISPQTQVDRADHDFPS